MESFLRVVYYGVVGIAALLILFFGASGYEGGTIAGTWKRKLVALTAVGAGYGILWFAVQLGHRQGEWIYGALVGVLGAVVFGVVMFLGLLIFTSGHWQ